MKDSHTEKILTVIAMLAKASSPWIQRAIIAIAGRFDSDTPQIGTHWTANFLDPDAGRNKHARTVEISLNQLGRSVWGQGHLQGRPNDPFEFKGTIKRNAFYGSFRRTNSHVLAGTGAFVLKISANTRFLTGHCSWYDSEVDDVWSTEYRWHRTGN